jgi:MFS family permease
MTTIALGTAGSRGEPGFLEGLWHRGLDHYPATGKRIFYLAIVVVTTIILYYELYVGGAVAPTILAHYNMSFRFYVYIAVVGNAIGALSSIIAGLADRWGRANLVAYGLGITGLLVLFGVPNAPNEWVFATLVIVIGFVEGIMLVATPALVRDFSPQLGRASAMGFWTLGPVIGSLCVSEVSSHTLAHLHAWQDQFVICGIVGLVVFVIALFGLRELSPGLRDQLMVSFRDRALIEARAKGIDPEKAMGKPWQMVRSDIVGSAFAISIFLLVYYAVVGFFVIYLTGIFGFTEQQANSIGNWFWAFDAGALVVIGFLSDFFKVRKPFMLVGAAGAIISMIFFLQKATQPHTGYYSMVLVTSLVAVFLAIAYAPWMASFTETIEKHNPALTATGLAIWGWIIRGVVAVSALIIPFVISSMTPIVTYGAQVGAIVKAYPQQVQTLGAIDPHTLATLSADPSNAGAIGTAVTDISTKLHVSPAVALGRLIAVSKVPKADLSYLSQHASAVESALKSAPSQWQHWWWVCFAGMVLFVPFIFTMVGRWSPKRARQDAEEHERKVAEELARLQVPVPAPAG